MIGTKLCQNNCLKSLFSVNNSLQWSKQLHPVLYGKKRFQVAQYVIVSSRNIFEFTALIFHWIEVRTSCRPFDGTHLGLLEIVVHQENLCYVGR